jgi:hypothetical protein
MMADRWIVSNSNDEWLDARRSLVTASEIGTLMGLFGDDRIAEMVREKRTGERAFTGNLLTEMGRALEPWLFSKIANGEVENLPEGRYVHNDGNAIRLAAEEGFGATIDVAQYEGDSTVPIGVWDMKITGYKLDNMPPMRHRMQVNWQMLCLGVDRGGIIAAHRWGAYCQAFPIERDDALIDSMIDAARGFLCLLATDASELKIVAAMQRYAYKEPEKEKGNDCTERGDF